MASSTMLSFRFQSSLSRWGFITHTQCQSRYFSQSHHVHDTLLKTVLPNRVVTRVSGVDNVKFLQGLVSNDVRLLSNESPILYAGFLSPNGRFQQDVFLFKENDDICIEHHVEFTEKLQKYLKRHKLRAKVKFSLDPSLCVHAAWIRKDALPSSSLTESAHNTLSYLPNDPRAPEMGWRWISNKESEKVPQSWHIDSVNDVLEKITSSTLYDYHIHRILNAVPEGIDDYPPVPLEGNLDWMNGISYTKGCYVGQELIARTHYKGVVRKRSASLCCIDGDNASLASRSSLFDLETDKVLIPANSDNVEDASPINVFPGDILVDAKAAVRRPRPSGHIGAMIKVQNAQGEERWIGYASVRLDLILDGPGIFRITREDFTPEESPHFKAFIPSWMRNRIEQSEEEEKTEVI